MQYASDKGEQRGVKEIKGGEVELCEVVSKEERLVIRFHYPFYMTVPLLLNGPQKACQ